MQYRCSCFCSFFKGENFIKGFIHNMLTQSIFPEVEFVFVNCNSPENEEQIILPIAEAYDNIKYIKLDQDPGLYAAWNIAIGHCSSDIITNWNIDDRKANNGLQLLVEALENNPKTDMVYGATFISKVPNETFEQNPKNELYPIYEHSFGNLLNHNSPHCMPMWRKSIHDKVGLFDEEYKTVSDADMWLKLTLAGGVIQIVRQPVGLYYWNPNGRSTDKQREIENFQEAIKMKNDILNRLNSSKIQIEDLVPCDTAYQNIYNDKIVQGKNHLKNKKIVIAGLCRSVGSVLEKNVYSVIDSVKNIVSDYKVLLFENDSTDNTKEILKNLKNNNDNIHYISQDYRRKHYGTVKDPERIKALAEYRSKVQEYIKLNWPNYDYIILFDTDFVDFSANGLLNSFGWIDNSNIDAVAGFSYTLKPLTLTGHYAYNLWNYDSWAYRESWWRDLENEPVYNSLQNYPKMLWFGLRPLPRGVFPTKVNSAFGGMVVYKMKDYLIGEYDHYDCEHVTFHRSIGLKNKSFNLFANPSQIMLLSE